MKTSLIPILIASNLALTFSTFSQASFGFRSYDPAYGIDVRVLNWDGQMLAGTNYLAELWGGATSNVLSPLVLAGSDIREIKPFNDSGYIISVKSALSVSDVLPNGWAWLQMRAWDAHLGAKYEDVAALGIGGYGESLMFYAQGRDPYRDPPESPAPLIGLQSFSLRAVVPEPSTWALLALGGLALGWASRRKTRN